MSDLEPAARDREPPAPKQAPTPAPKAPDVGPSNAERQTALTTGAGQIPATAGNSAHPLAGGSTAPTPGTSVTPGPDTLGPNPLTSPGSSGPTEWGENNPRPLTIRPSSPFGALPSTRWSTGPDPAIPKMEADPTYKSGLTPIADGPSAVPTIVAHENQPVLTNPSPTAVLGKPPPAPPAPSGPHPLAPTTTYREAFSGKPSASHDNTGALVSGIGTATQNPALGVAGAAIQAKGNYDTLVKGVKPDGSPAGVSDRVAAGTNLASPLVQATGLAAKGGAALAKQSIAGKAAQAGTPLKQAQAAAGAAIQGGDRMAIKQAARDAGTKGRDVNKVLKANRTAMEATKGAGAAKGAAKYAKVAEKIVNGAGDARALKNGVKGVGKGAGKFIPGLNGVIAATDTYTAASDFNDWRNGKASTGKALTSGLRAAGSLLSATNIPVVSQIGAVGSIAADLAQRFWWNK
ncbi:MAG: hypothetical protein H6737_03975 [Alphaproteobacteria bacterium]|nr:hypothetical protein [Alphaproteobacteria bacterium]